MKKGFLALALALTMLPLAAAAQTPPAAGGRPALTPEQRQALATTFKTFGAKEAQLYKQMRTGLLASIPPIHRQAIANVIGQLAISPNPDRKLAVKQLDAVLSQGEKARILALHSAFQAQSKTLRDQLRTQLQSELPAGGPPGGNRQGHMMRGGNRPQWTPDAGRIVLEVLGSGGMHRGGMHGKFMMHPPAGGAPPQ